MGTGPYSRQTCLARFFPLLPGKQSQPRTTPARGSLPARPHCHPPHAPHAPPPPVVGSCP